MKKPAHDIRLYDSAEKLHDVWNELLPQNTFLRTKHLAIYERLKIPDVRYIYAISFHQSRPVAVAYFQLLNIKKYHFNKSLLNRPVYTLINGITALAKPKLLIAGHLFRHDVQCFYANEKLTALEAFNCYKGMIEKVLRAYCASAVLVKDAPPILAEIFSHQAPEYLLLRNDISMQMDIPSEWKSIKDYEATLKHKYAQRLRKIFRSRDELSFKEMDTEAVAANSKQLYRLYENIIKHQSVRIGILSESFLPELKKLYPEQLKIWGIYHNDTLVAFTSAWKNNDVYDMFYIGFDYEKNSELNLYFNLLFFCLENAIRYGCGKLVLGRTAIDAKVRLGATPHYLDTFLYIKNAFLRRMVFNMQQRIYLQDKWEEKHPFKKQ